jgi:hypothetical protein
VELSFNEIRAALDAALTELELWGINGIDFKKDYYWKVPLEHKFNLEYKGTAADCGQLTYDAEILKKMACTGEGSGASLVFFGAILDYLATHFNDLVPPVS